jgi:hypothetical protein
MKCFFGTLKTFINKWRLPDSNESFEQAKLVLKNLNVTVILLVPTKKSCSCRRDCVTVLTSDFYPLIFDKGFAVS